MIKDNEIRNYSDLLEHLKLKNISIQHLEIKKFSVPGLKGAIKIKFGFNSQKPDYQQTGDELNIIQPIIFEVIKDSENDKEIIKIFELKVVYVLNYYLSRKINEELFMEYSKNTIPKLLHPYLRELISSSINRVGMPPLTIPLYENL